MSRVPIQRTRIKFRFYQNCARKRGKTFHSEELQVINDRELLQDVILARRFATFPGFRGNAAL